MSVKRIGIFTGVSWEKWDLETYRVSGQGGSEACAARLAQTAAENGHSVVLYGNHEEKVQQNVQLVHWKNFKPEKEAFDLFIASRDISAVNKKLSAKKVLAWLHDVIFVPKGPLPPFHRKRIDQFIVLSPWHKQFIKQCYHIHDEQLEIIPHGINVELFGEYNPRNKVYGKLLWPSSPDRGLENLLAILPKIRKVVPEIHLELTYGMFYWMTRAVARKDQAMLQKVDTLNRLIKQTEGVFNHGRVGQAELAALWEQAYLWVYPTKFLETYCLSAKEAQLSGTPTICSRLAALETTVDGHGVLIDSDPATQAGRKEFLDKTLEFLTNKKLWQELSEKTQQGAKKASWQNRWEQYWNKWLD